MIGDRYRERIARVALALALASGFAAGAAAEPVPVRAGVHEGYGRLVFNWPTPVPYRASADGLQLVVTFGRPIETEFDVVLRRLGKYLSAARTEADGRTVTLGLRGPHAIRDFSQGAAVVVDILDASVAPPEPTALATPRTDVGAAAAESVSQSASSPAAAPPAPVIRVRVGEHDGFSRLVFDWPERVGYRISRDGARAVVDFKRPARLELSQFRSQRPKFVRDLAFAPSADGTRVTFTVPETARVRDFLSGPKVVIDVTAPRSGAQGPVTAAARPAPRPEVKIEKAPVPGTETPPASPVGPGAEAPAEAKAPADRSAATAAKPTPLVPRRPAGGVSTTPSGGATKGTAEAAEAGPVAGTAVAPQTQASQAAVSASAVEGSPDAIRLRFDWNEPVAAAAFRRAEALWLVFDKPSNVDLEALRAAGGNALKNLEQIPIEGATALKLATISGINPSVRRQGFSWIFEFRRQEMQPPTPVETQVQGQPTGGARVFLPVPEPGRAIPMHDPVIGDNLVVVPVIPLGHGVSPARSYPQFDVLASVQGVVIRPKIDSLRVRPLRGGIELTSSEGLQVSSTTARAESEPTGGFMRPLTRAFDLEKWRRLEPSEVKSNLRELQLAAATVDEAARESARLELARFSFANGLAHEATGVLSRIAEDRPAITDEPEFRTLRGAAFFIMNRIPEAEADLTHPSLEGLDEAAFWLAALRASGGDAVGAAPTLKRTSGIIRPYPAALKVPLGLIVSEAAIEMGDVDEAKNQLEFLGVDPPGPIQKAKIGFVQGRLSELSGDFEGAVGKWEEVMQGPDRSSRAKAAFARAELLLKLREITPAEAIEEFEDLRFAWRGDDFEFKLLRRLGDLYLAEEHYREGLRALRQAVTHFRAHPEASAITRQMADSFAKLYLDDKADALAPVTAIALYDEFKELTPAGEKGDALIRKLADRLVGVDLLDGAAKLLQAQVDFRLAGVEKARVGADLAQIHLFDDKPEKAEKALKQTARAGLPEDIADRRQHLMARTLADMGRLNEAMEILEGNESVDAELLRVEFFWSERNWPRAAQSLRRLVQAMELSSAAALDDPGGRLILNLAIALTLSGNERSVDRLRTDFGEAMDGTSFRHAFRLIASPQTQGLLDYRTIANKVADVEQFREFVASYRQGLPGDIPINPN